MLDRPGIERVGHVHRLRGSVDLYPAVLHLGKGMAAVAEGRQQSRLGCHNRRGARRFAGL